MAIHVSDELLAIFVPIAVYWAYSGLYVVLEPYLERYRIHPKGAEEEKNIATRLDVVKGALLGHAFQIAVNFFIIVNGAEAERKPQQPPVAVAAGQFVAAMMVLDAWQYFVHRLLHTVPFLYKHIHSKHHRLVVNYPYGAQFTHPVEGFLVDTIGGAVAFAVTGMTATTAMYFFTFATVKGIEDHTGLFVPWNPLHRLFENNSVWHDVHHQLHGQKFNYATPFFCVWDKLLGTYMGYTLEEREGGGYVSKPVLKNSKDD